MQRNSVASQEFMGNFRFLFFVIGCVHLTSFNNREKGPIEVEDKSSIEQDARFDLNNFNTFLFIRQ